MVYLIVAAVLVSVFVVLQSVLKKYQNKYGVTYIAGNIGSGKSCLSVKIAQRYLRRGWSVYSNDSMQGALKLNVSDLEHFALPENSLVIIDEASLEFNSRSFSKIKLTLIEYFKLCRHYKNKCIIISQTFGDTDKQIRELANEMYFIRVILSGVLSLPVKVRGDIGIDNEGQPCVKYKLSTFGEPLIIPLYVKKYNSFNHSRPLLKAQYWADIDTQQ